jgi:hypothetical protein
MYGTVERVEWLTPHLMRVLFGGKGLDGLAVEEGLDRRVRQVRSAACLLLRRWCEVGAGIDPVGCVGGMSHRCSEVKMWPGGPKNARTHAC